MNSITGVIVKKHQRNVKVIDVAIIEDGGRKLYLECHKKSERLFSSISGLSLLSKVTLNYRDYADENRGQGNRSVITECIRL